MPSSDGTGEKKVGSGNFASCRFHLFPSLDGFDIIAEAGATKMPIASFVTAHNSYAVKAFEAFALNYLTKPVELGRLRTALDRARSRVTADNASAARARHDEASESEVRPKTAFAERLLIPHGTREVLVNVKDIEWIESANYYSSLHVGGRTQILRTPIKDLAASLDGRRFVRVHRAVIVNLDFVREVNREGRGEGSVVMHGGQRLRMSPTGWQPFVAANRKS